LAGSAVSCLDSSSRAKPAASSSVILVPPA
jgi:hypothetical protein